MAKPDDYLKRLDTPKGLPREVIALAHVAKFRDDFDDKFRQTLDSAKEKGNDKVRFWNMLVEQVNKTGFQPASDRQLEILDIACGKGAEASVLNSFFGNNATVGVTNDKVNVTGIDINKDAINKAISSHQQPTDTFPTTYEFPSYLKFIHGDATNLEHNLNIPKSADVIVIRHQQISADEGIWSKIFQQAINKLSDNGIIIFTSYSDVEHAMLAKKIGELGLNVVVNEKNQYALPTEHQNVSIDRNILIAKK